MNTASDTVVHNTHTHTHGYLVTELKLERMRI